MSLDHGVELKVGDLVQATWGFNLYLCEEFPKTLRDIEKRYIGRNVTGIVLKEKKGILIRLYIDSQSGWADYVMFERIGEGTR